MFNNHILVSGICYFSTNMDTGESSQGQTHRGWGKPFLWDGVLQ